jgi:hypothetical protein
MQPASFQQTNLTPTETHSAASSTVSGPLNPINQLNKTIETSVVSTKPKVPTQNLFDKIFGTHTGEDPIEYVNQPFWDRLRKEADNASVALSLLQMMGAPRVAPRGEAIAPNVEPLPFENIPKPENYLLEEYKAGTMQPSAKLSARKEQFQQALRENKIDNPLNYIKGDNVPVPGSVEHTISEWAMEVMKTKPHAAP